VGDNNILAIAIPLITGVLVYFGGGRLMGLKETKNIRGFF
jgi:hypothetical protein